MEEGRVRIFVEDWAAQYGSPYLVADGEPEGVGVGEVVEHGGRLRPCRPEPGGGRGLGRVAFVDGVRRVESVLYGETPGGALARGVAGAHAYGAAVASGDEPCRFERCRSARLVIWAEGHREQLPEVGGCWRWQAASTSSAEPDAPVHELQERMRQAEWRLAEELCDEGWLTVVDGPLHYHRSRDLPLVGVVKTHHRRLLAPDDHARVPQLGAGERTSLFRLRADVYSAYLRLAEPARQAGPWSGIVRCDLPASVGVAAAGEVADRAALDLPRFAGVAHVDPRAPQNLQPIGALERHLRHLLGDAGLAARAVRDAVAAREDAAGAATDDTAEEVRA